MTTDDILKRLEMLDLSLHCIKREGMTIDPITWENEYIPWLITQLRASLSKLDDAYETIKHKNTHLDQYKSAAEEWSLKAIENERKWRAALARESELEEALEFYAEVTGNIMLEIPTGMTRSETKEFAKESRRVMHIGDNARETLERVRNMRGE